jgi:hypothetical protein
MIDLQNIYVLDTIDVSHVELFSTSPTILTVRGEDFSNVSFIEVNGVDVVFDVVSAKELLVTLPPELSDTPLQTLNVFSKSPTITSKASMFSYEIGSNPKFVDGPAKVLMHVLKVMLTTPGTDIDDPELGGNLQNMGGGRVNLASPYSLAAKVVIMVNSVATQIAARQSNLALPQNEKLRDIEILAVNYNENDPSVASLRIKVNTYANKSALAQIALGK